jgi:hypothetical protein
MLRELDDEISHRLGRHQVGAAFGAAEARQVDRDHRTKRFDFRPDRTVGVDTFRPGLVRRTGTPSDRPPRARRISRPSTCEVVTWPILGRLVLMERS